MTAEGVPASFLDTIEAVLGEIDAGHQRMAVRRTGEREEIPAAVRRGVWIRDNGRCRWCGDTTRDLMRLDHIVPWSAGGSDRSDNLRVLCEPCNDRRSNFRTDADTARAVPVASACSRCAARPGGPWYEGALYADRPDVVDEDPPGYVGEMAEPTPAFCARCCLAGVADRRWTL